MQIGGKLQRESLIGDELGRQARGVVAVVTEGGEKSMEGSSGERIKWILFIYLM